jgi:hypothetical protein
MCVYCIYHWGSGIIIYAENKLISEHDPRDMLYIR